MNKKFINYNYGITLLEILISIFLGIILLLSISGIYILTNKLNLQAKNKLNINEKFLFVANLIEKDISMAGNFACLSIASINGANSLDNQELFNKNFSVQYTSDKNKRPPILFDRPNTINDANSSIPDENKTFGILWLDARNLPISDALNTSFEFKNKALIFIYGIGSTSVTELSVNNKLLEKISFVDADRSFTLSNSIKNGGYFALASCKALNVFKIEPRNKLDFTNKDFETVYILDESNIKNIGISNSMIQKTQDNTSLSTIKNDNLMQKTNEIELLKYYVSLYVIARDKKTNKGNLYRLELDDNGILGNLEEILPDVNNIDVDFLYISSYSGNKKNLIGCPQEKFKNIDYYNTFSIVQKNEQNKKIFDGDNITTLTLFKQQDNLKKHISPAAIKIKLSLNKKKYSRKSYTITEVVRGGNSCANRILNR